MNTKSHHDFPRVARQRKEERKVTDLPSCIVQAGARVATQRGQFHVVSQLRAADFSLISSPPPPSYRLYISKRRQRSTNMTRDRTYGVRALLHVAYFKQIIRNRAIRQSPLAGRRERRNSCSLYFSLKLPELQCTMNPRSLHTVHDKNI